MLARIAGNSYYLVPFKVRPGLFCFLFVFRCFPVATICSSILKYYNTRYRFLQDRELLGFFKNPVIFLTDIHKSKPEYKARAARLQARVVGKFVLTHVLPRAVLTNMYIITRQDEGKRIFRLPLALMGHGSPIIIKQPRGHSRGCFYIYLTDSRRAYFVATNSAAAPAA